MSYAYFSKKNAHGSHMCCEVGTRDVSVFVENDVNAVPVNVRECISVEHISKLAELLSDEQCKSICSDERSSKESLKELCKMCR